MPIEQILSALVAERDRLQAAIDVLSGTNKVRRANGTAAPTPMTPHKRTMSEAARKKIAAAAKKRWAAIKAAKKG